MGDHRQEPVAGALQNMSAPPRMRIAVRPLKRTIGKEPAAPTLLWQENRLHRIASVSIDTLIRHHFPAFQAKPGDDRGASWTDVATLKGRESDTSDLRLRCLVVISRLATGGLKKLTRRSVFALAGKQTADLEARYLENVARLDPVLLGLPPFGLVRLGDGTSSETDPARALALLSRAAGNIYCSARTPVLPQHERHQEPLSLYAYNQAVGEEHV